MATQTDLDRVQIAWQQLQRAVNTTLPAATSKVWAIRKRIAPTPSGPPGSR